MCDAKFCSSKKVVLSFFLSAFLVTSCFRSRAGSAENGSTFLSKDEVSELFQEGSFEQQAALENLQFVPLAELMKNVVALKSEQGWVEEKTESLETTEEGDTDLRKFDTPVKNQGNRGLCTAFGTISTMENLGAQKTQKKYDISEIHLWSLYQRYNTHAALSAAQANMLVSEEIWPYYEERPKSDTQSSGFIKVS